MSASRAAYMRDYRAANLDKVRAQYRKDRRRYVERNRAEINEKQNEVYYDNHEERKARQRQYAAENREAEAVRARDHRNKSRAALNPPEFCEVCGSSKKICWDHCHVRGSFRGWLCDSCNVALGRVKDNPEILRKLAAYVEESNRRFAAEDEHW